MRKFILTVFKFCLFPLAILLVVGPIPIYIGFVSGEIYAIDKIVERHILDKDIIVGTVLQNTDKYLKFYTAQSIKPEVLVLGTSRVMQFTRNNFKNRYTFYNAGGAVHSSHGYKDFINKLNYNPKIIIVGFDQYFFNNKWNEKSNSLHNYEYNYKPILILEEGLRLFIKGDVNIFKLKNKNKSIGLNAVIHGDGFKSDGSYYYNRIINCPDTEYSKKFLYPFEDTMARIISGERRFEYGDVVDDKAISEIEEFLSICKKRNIEVVAIIPPFAPLISDKLQSTGKYNYIKCIYPKLVDIFKRLNYELYDFSYSKSIGDNSYYIDGFHGNSQVYSNIVSEILANGSKLKDYAVFEK